ncbi:SET domain-containing protein [Tieghemostelium lacteum]|uniref:SET domain-containing protein n=1 Tax=Tieghemostelium lacteum TaxID=361077 RepID=A0A151Z479_TIELA|nr:SET domain-containing protein [Tieghemostelium lacteum]|eukprot:KYQ88770.1 SET domain-containing protein [Tieghemostelium lacteum]
MRENIKRLVKSKKTKDITSQTIKLSALSSIHANHVTSNEIEYISITDDSPVDDFITKFMNPYDQQLFSLPYLFGIQRLS